MIKYKAVLWDFAGVWSKDYFYKSLRTSRPQIWEFIQTKVWGPGGDGRIDKWMKAEFSLNDINYFISQNTGIDYDTLTKISLHDVAKMDIETGHISIVKHLKQAGINVGMVTDNMDVFSTITVPRLKLNELFNGNVFNSSDYKTTKADGLFDIATKAMGISYCDTLLIEDSLNAGNLFKSKGGHHYHYTSFEDFQLWANSNLLN